MPWEEVALLCLGASVGACAAFSDMRHGKIGNGLILFALSGGLPLNLLLINEGQSGMGPYAANICVTVIIAGVLYARHYWGGGDSKLMIALGATFPCNEYRELGIYLGAPAVVAFASTFLISYVQILLETIGLSSRSARPAAKGEWHGAGKATTASYLRSLAWLVAISALFNLLPLHLDSSVAILITLGKMGLLLALQRASFFANTKVTAAVTLLAVLALVVGYYVPAVGDAAILLVLVGVKMLNRIAAPYGYEDKGVDELRAGDILAMSNLPALLDLGDEGVQYISMLTEDMRSRLGEVEAANLQSLCLEKSVPTLAIVKKVPFARYISLGYVALFVWSRLVA